MASNFLIISEDPVFSSIMHRHLVNHFNLSTIKKINSYSSLKLINEDIRFDLILLDDSIKGAANYEIISYLRLHKNITTSVIYFSNMEIDEEKARQKGANIFFKKPFVPSEVIKGIESLLD
ncbi:response regulator [Plebeiibacterium sediminum]|uniref:Response regulator n=1 Tax=Plebeiibacterium sediminum TaxID=2992112 RepID=A0AAE3M3Q9_9BACT|nr:response regulator [Plebeiobacterium sediminum]MCW3786252.1 response regulator [Plebeiobacterium sediminum]